MEYAINSAKTPVLDSRGFMRPEWYRFLVQIKAQGSGVTEAPIVTFGDAAVTFPNSKQLTAATGELTTTESPTAVTLGLADTAVTPTTYGAADRLVVLSIDQKGRVTGAAEIVLNSDNVHEGTTNLFFTQARARLSLSAGAGIAYNNVTGAIATTGFNGTGAYTNFTFANGICTAAS